MAIGDKQNLQKEFKEFLEIVPGSFKFPDEFSKKLINRLFPNPWSVFGKVALVHVFFGLLSLGVCSQFDLNPFNTNFSLSNWFLQIGGDKFCMCLCGVFFMASTYCFSNLFLTLEELEAIKRQIGLQSGVLGLVSLAAFYFFGAQLVVTVTLLWLLGVLIGGVLSVELSYRLRQAWI